MKKTHLFTASVLASFAIAALAQTLNISTGNVTIKVNAEQAGDMTYNDAESLTVQGNTLKLSEISEMTVTDDTFDDNLVEIVFDGESASAAVAGNVAQYIDITFDGAHVTVTQSDKVSDKTCGEITYVLKGESENGSLILNGSFKSTIELQGLTLTNPSGAAIDIENGKRIEMSVKNGTVNSLTDGKGKQKAALYCKGHLELKGKGTLNVEGNTGHAIAAKEYIEMKNCTVNITKAAKDGINCVQHFLMESGSLTISGVDGDGIQTDYDDPTANDSDDTGSITIEDGKVDITISGAAAKGFKSEGDCIISGGEVTISSDSPGEWDSDKLKTKSSACIGADENVTISGGTISLTANGGGAKGIGCDGDLTFDGGDMTIITTGGALVYKNGTLSQNYTGNDLDRIDSDYKSSPKGIRCEGDVNINGGTIYVKTTGNNGEGIESKNILTVTGGNITVRAKDDGINSSSHMFIKGGVIDVIATANDGLDANGSIYIQGGVIMAFGAGNPECGIDANEEKGYTVVISGGYLLACGGNNSVPSSTSNSKQPYVQTSGSVTGGTEISIGTDSETIYTFNVPADYSGTSGGNSGPGGGPGGWGSGSGSSIIISTPQLVNGTTYTVRNGSTTTTATAQLTGKSNGRP